MTILTKFLLPALAISGLAVAKSDCDGKQEIQNQGDAEALASCSTIDGDVTISKKAEGVITLDGVKRIKGKFTSEDAGNVTELSAPKLKTIDGEFTLISLTSLSSLQFDALEEVESIRFEALPKLQSFSFTKTVTKADHLKIINTDLTSLKGIDLKTVKSMEIANNRHLTEVNVNQISNATGIVSFSANNLELKIKFPNLESAQNMTFRNASTVELPSLKKAKGLLGFYSNYFEDFIAPNLTSVGDIVFNDNSALTNISLPVLEKINNAFQVANNTALKKFKGAPELTNIGGTFDFSGNFSVVEIPKVKEIGGKFNLQSSGNVSCDPFDKMKKKEIQGKYTCIREVDDPQKDSPSSTRSGSGPDATKSGSADPSARVPTSVTFLALLGSALGLVL